MVPHLRVRQACRPPPRQLLLSQVQENLVVLQQRVGLDVHQPGGQEPATHTGTSRGSPSYKRVMCCGKRVKNGVLDGMCWRSRASTMPGGACSALVKGTSKGLQSRAVIIKLSCVS